MSLMMLLRRMMMSEEGQEESEVDKPIQLIGTIEVTEETAENVAFIITAEEYPEIRECKYFWIHVDNKTNKSMPYILMDVNGNECFQTTSGNTGCTDIAGILVNGNMIAFDNGWYNITLSTLKRASTTVMRFPVYVGTVESIGVRSYTAFLDAGATVEVYGF